MLKEEGSALTINVKSNGYVRLQLALLSSTGSFDITLIENLKEACGEPSMSS
jgi:hypothetical protein